MVISAIEIADAELFVNRPLRPLPEFVRNTLLGVLRGMAGVQEAHLPQIFIRGRGQGPGPVLVLVLRPGVSKDRIVEFVRAGLLQNLPHGVALEVWPLYPDDPRLDQIRAVDCRLLVHPGGAKRWWAFWR